MNSDENKKQRVGEPAAQAGASSSNEDLPFPAKHVQEKAHAKDRVLTSVVLSPIPNVSFEDPTAEEARERLMVLSNMRHPEGIVIMPCIGHDQHPELDMTNKPYRNEVLFAAKVRAGQAQPGYCSLSMCVTNGWDVHMLGNTVRKHWHSCLKSFFKQDLVLLWRELPTLWVMGKMCCTEAVQYLPNPVTGGYNAGFQPGNETPIYKLRPEFRNSLTVTLASGTRMAIEDMHLLDPGLIHPPGKELYCWTDIPSGISDNTLWRGTTLERADGTLIHACAPPLFVPFGENFAYLALEGAFDGGPYKEHVQHLLDLRTLTRSGWALLSPMSRGTSGSWPLQGYSTKFVPQQGTHHISNMGTLQGQPARMTLSTAMAANKESEQEHRSVAIQEGNERGGHRRPRVP